MAGCAPLKPIRITIALLGFLGALGGWFAPAMDASQYDWFKWYDGLLFPVKVIITPGYYLSVSSILMLILPSIVILTAVALSLLRLIGQITAPAYADDHEVEEMRHESKNIQHGDSKRDAQTRAPDL